MITENVFRSGEEVRKAIDEAMLQYYDIDRTGKCRPIVCIICDRFCPKDWCIIKVDTLKNAQETLKASDVLLPASLRASYAYDGEGKETWMSDMLLSKYGIFKMGRNKGFVCCNSCKNSLGKSKTNLPRHAIANGFYFGEAPKELKDLSQSEVAMLTPTRVFGYCFTYVGGENMRLKGTLGYFKLKPGSIARAIGVSSVLADNLNRDVVYILSGKMTEKQRQKARDKSKIRPQKMVAAIRWLQKNNAYWKHVNIDNVIETVQQFEPMLIDHSTVVEVESENAIEDEESLSVYFPDGSMTEVYGGQNSAAQFRQAVARARNNGFDGEIVTHMSREFVRDYVQDTFVTSCLLQMPYGRGGPDETRNNEDEEGKSKWTLEQYADHVSMVSNPEFHTPLFILKLFNIKLRSIILKSATQQMHSSMSSVNLRETISAEDFQVAARAYAEGRSEGTPQSQRLVKCIAAVNRNIPHSNGAVKRARMFMEAMQQTFGLGGMFLTVTPDDENSFLVTAYSQIDNNGKPIDLDNISDEVLRENAKKRREVRIRFPGITALNMQYIIDVVIRELVGWDVKNRCPTKHPGLFGVPLAFGGAVEEQGRTSLHVHLIVWLRGWDTYLENVTSTNREARTSAELIVTNVVNNSLTTNLIGDNATQLRKASSLWQMFEHNCKETNPRKRKKPEMADNQQLRNLRHKHCHLNEPYLMKCGNCDKSWTNEDIVLRFINYNTKLDIAHFPDTTKKMEQYCYDNTKPVKNIEVKRSILHANYNNHNSSHCKSCFKKKSESLFAQECRMRLPDLENNTTKVVNVPLQEDGKNEIPWFLWTGKEVKKKIVEVKPKRDIFDVFQNTSCWPVTESVIGGNSNGRVITPGPIGLYTVKYPTKNTQESEAEEYKNAIDQYGKAVQKESIHRTDWSDSLGLIHRAIYGHNVTNILAAPMAGYLLRNGSRFMFSHEFAFIPVKGLLTALQSGNIERAAIRTVDGFRYADSLTLDYLCRPSQLRHLNPFEFFTRYESIRNFKQRNDSREVFHFRTTENFKHPSHVTVKGVDKEFQVCRERFYPHLPWIFQFQFPDSANFGGENILECASIKINDDMEKYASMVLCLFHTYENHEDLVIFDEEREKDSYVAKLRQVIRQNDFEPKYLVFLQNVQNSRANFGRVKPGYDELQLYTDVYTPQITSAENKCKNNKDDEEGVRELQGCDLNNFLKGLEEEIAKENNSNNVSSGIFSDTYVPSTLNCKKILDKGTFRCGYEKLCDIEKGNVEQDGLVSFVERTEASSSASIEIGAEQTELTNEEKKAKLNRQDLMDIIVKKKDSVMRQFDFNDVDVEKPVCMANGSARSIKLWGEAAGFDDEQRRAFEVFASSFVLTYFEEASQEIAEDTNKPYGTRNRKFLEEKLKLMKLAGRIPTHVTRLPMMNNKNRMRCLLHGPAGSGKSAIIDVLLMYARDYCEFLDEPFTPNTIVVSAMSGVAASMIKGQTTHKALFLNNKGDNISDETKEVWKGTRLVIIDEISFASRSDIENMDRKLRILTDKAKSEFGNVDIIFCGDFRQLEPPMADAIYDTQHSIFHHNINCYIELYGMHRFKHDPEWGELLKRFRDGKLTEDDIDTINSRVVKKVTDIPKDIQYATYANKDRAAINTGLFKQYCTDDAGIVSPNSDTSIVKDSIIIFASDIKVSKGSRHYVTQDNAWLAWFFENCSEGDTEPAGHSGRFDPALMLYYGRPVMVNANLDVTNDKANGTRAHVSQIYLKEGANPTMVTVEDGNCREVRKVPAYRTSQIQSIRLRRERSGECGTPKFFDIQPVDAFFYARVPIPRSLQVHGKRGKTVERLRMSGRQFPIVCNNATTGHKLQGAGVENLFVHTWSSVRNWIYVVLSRVKKISGLYLRRPLDKDLLEKLNEIPKGLTDMIKKFKTYYWQRPFNAEEYRGIFGTHETTGAV